MTDMERYWVDNFHTLIYQYAGWNAYYCKIDDACDEVMG